MPYYPPPPYYGGYGQPMGIRSILIITLVIIALLIGIYVYASAKAKKDMKEELPAEYADEQYTAEESKKIRYYSSAIIEDIDGFSVMHDVPLYEALLKESDRIFEGVCIDFKRLQGVSLRKALDDEISFTNLGKYIEIRKKVIARINQLNIA